MSSARRSEAEVPEALGQQNSPVSDTAGPSAAMLEIRDVSFAYPERDVLSDVSLSVRAGEILVLLGPNGAGKSTLVKTISGQVRPSKGTVRIGGRDPAFDSEARRAAGFVPQSIAIFDKLTVRENLGVFGEVMGAAHGDLGALADRTLEQIGLTARQDDRVAVLSGGMRRLVNIGAAMMHGPKLLVLDEPTVGVDNRTRDHLRDVMWSLRDRGLAVLLTTHDMEEAEALADRISIIVGGRIMAEGPPHEIVEAAFGSKQEVRVVLDASLQTKRQFAGHCSRLQQLGLKPSQDNTVWEGLVGNEDGRLAKLTLQMSGAAKGVVEMRIRQPGLRTLLAWYVG